MSDTIQEVEISLDHAKKLVASKDAVEKLMSNREFKKVILDGYFKEEAARLASISADPLHAAHRGEIILAIQGISLLYGYLQKTLRIGQVAESEMREHRELLDELREQESVLEGEAA